MGLLATIVGTDGDDTLTGTWQNDLIVAYDGDDTIWAGSGDDTICAGPGADVINGESGNDSIDGADGNDQITGSDGIDTIWGGPGNDTITGDSQPDTIYGGPGDDTINGGADPDVLDGGDGIDTIDGSWQDDTCDDAETPISCETITALGSSNEPAPPGAPEPPPVSSEPETTIESRTYDGDGTLTQVVVTAPDDTVTTDDLLWDPTLGVPQIVTWDDGTTTDNILYGHQREFVGAAVQQYNAVGDSYAPGGEWSPFGPTSTQSGLAFGYRGELETSASVHLRARELVSGLARFDTLDPLPGVMGTPTFGNPYHYADNDPINLSDPLGLRTGDDQFVGVATAPTGRGIPAGYYYGAQGGGWPDLGIADAITGRDIGDYSDFIVSTSAQFQVDPALILALGLIEQGFSGLCRGCMAMLEQVGVADTHGLTNISEEVFVSVMSAHRVGLQQFVPGAWQEKNDSEIWKLLGEQVADELAIAVTIAHVRDRIAYFNGVDIDPRLGVSVNEFAALSWNFNRDTVTDIATGNRAFGALTTDYIETLRWNYWQVGFSVTCPEVASCDFGPAPLSPT